MPSVAFFRLTARSVLCVCMERNSLPTVPGTDNSHNRRQEVSPVNIDDAGEIERSIAAFARSPNGGLILTGSPLTILRRDLIIALAARHKLPAIYYDRYFVVAGGLMSYGPDN